MTKQEKKPLKRLPRAIRAAIPTLLLANPVMAVSRAMSASRTQQRFGAVAIARAAVSETPASRQPVRHHPFSAFGGARTASAKSATPADDTQKTVDFLRRNGLLSSSSSSRASLSGETVTEPGYRKHFAKLNSANTKFVAPYTSTQVISCPGQTSVDSVTYSSTQAPDGGPVFCGGFKSSVRTAPYISQTDPSDSNGACIQKIQACLNGTGGTNNAPTVTGIPLDVTVTEDTASNFDLSGVTFTDLDGDSLTVTLAASAGTLTATSGGGVTVGGASSGTLTLTGMAGNINAYLDTTSNIKYSGAANTTGNDAATVTVNASDGTDNPTLGTINVGITAVNDAPTLTGVPMDISVTEETASNFDVSAATLADVEGDNITVTLAADTGTLSAVSGGGVTVNGSGTGTLTLAGTAGTINAYLDTTSNIQYTGAANASGNDATTVSINVNDGTVNPLLATVNVDITDVNDEPTLTATASNPTFTEGGAAASLFNGTTISTVESGQTVSGFTFTVTNLADGSNERVNLDGSTIILINGTSGTTNTNSLSYSISVVGSTATVSLSGGTVSASAAQTLIDNIRYQNNSKSPSTGNRVVTITSLQDTGGTANGGDNSVALAVASTVTIVQNNDEPTLTATGSNPTFTEGGSAVSLFSGSSISTVEAGQTLSAVTLTVTNVYDASSEILNTDGTAIALANGTSGTTATNSLNYNVAVSGTTAAVTLSGGTLSSAATQTLVDNLNYQHNSNTPNTSSRVVTITSLQDSGGTANGGDDTAALAVASMVTLVGVNDEPTLTATGSNPTFTEDGAAASLFTGTSISTIESGQTVSGFTLTVTNLADGSNERINLDGSTIILTNGTSGVSVSNNLNYSVSVVGSTATVSLSGSTLSASVAQTLINSISYQNNSESPSTSNRVVTITSLQDSGGTANGGDNTASLAIASTVSIVDVNDATTATSVPSDITFTEDTAGGLDLSAVEFADADSGTITVTFGLSGGTFSTPAEGSGVGGGVTVTLANSTTITLSGSPADINTYLDTTGNIQYTGASNVNGDNQAKLTISVNDGDGSGDVTLGAVNIDIDDVNDPPTVETNTGVSVDQGKTVVIQASELSAADPDDSSSGLIFTVTRLTGHGTLFLDANGNEILDSGEALALSDTFTQADINDGDLTYAHDGADRTSDDFGFSLADGGEDGAGSVTGNTVNITITPAIPEISGTPTKTIAVGNRYSFVPVVANPSELSLAFSIAHRPDWATFDPKTGRLTGTPDSEDIGVTRDIVISVSGGGKGSSLLKFNLQVTEASGTSDGQNSGSAIGASEPVGDDSNNDLLVVDADDPKVQVRQSTWPSYTNDQPPQARYELNYVDQYGARHSIRVTQVDTSGSLPTTSGPDGQGKQTLTFGGSGNEQIVTLAPDGQTTMTARSGGTDMSTLFSRAADLDVTVAASGRITSTTQVDRPDGSSTTLKLVQPTGGGLQATSTYAASASAVGQVTTHSFEMPTANARLASDGSVTISGQFEDGVDDIFRQVRLEPTGLTSLIATRTGAQPTAIVAREPGSTSMVTTGGDVSLNPSAHAATIAVADNSLTYDAGTVASCAAVALTGGTFKEICRDNDPDLNSLYRAAEVSSESANGARLLSRLEVTDTQKGNETVYIEDANDSDGYVAQRALSDGTLSVQIRLDGSSVQQVSGRHDLANNTVTSLLLNNLSLLFNDRAITAVDNGATTFYIEALANGKVQHEVALNGFSTQAISNLPGSRTLLATGGDGQPVVTTRAEYEGRHIQVVGQTDGHASHQVINRNGTTSQAGFGIAGTYTTIASEGVVRSRVRLRGNETCAWVETFANGESNTGFGFYDESTARCTGIDRPTNEGNPFEAGNQVRVEGDDDTTSIIIETQLNRPIKF